jgi:hypothetical protein
MSRHSGQSTMNSRHWWIRLCQLLWRGFLFLWTFVILALVLGIVTTWLTTKNFDISGTPLEWIPDHWPLVLAGGGLLLVLTVVAGYFGWPVAAPVQGLPTPQDRRELIRRLSNEYRRQQIQSLQEATTKSLERDEPVEATLSSPSLVSWRMDVNGEAFPATATPILQAYDKASAGLLVLGEPGVGKSTLLLELTFILLTRAEQDEHQPIPVLVNLSSWALNKPPLAIWLEEQLYSMLAIPRQLSHAWIEQNGLLLLLDGLDEMEPSARTTCVASIDVYRDRAEHLVRLVVSSRREEYLAQEGRLKLLDIVEVQPLTPEQVDGYLMGGGKPMAAVRTALRSDVVLRDLVTTPLMLSVVMLAYHGKTVKDLPHPGLVEEQRRLVFEHYVTQMLEQRSSMWHYASQQTLRWLIWLAEQMKQHQLTEFYLERLQPTWLPTKRPRMVYALISGFAFGLVGGTLFGLVGLLIGGLVDGLVGAAVGLLIGVLIGGLELGLIGLLVGWLGHLNAEYPPWPWRPFWRVLLLGGWSGRKDWEIRPVERLAWSWRSFWRMLILNVLIGWLILELFFGLLGLLIPTYVGGPLVGLVIGAIFGLIFGLFIGLIVGLRGGLLKAQIEEHMRLRPNQGIRNSGWNALRIGLGSLVVVGLLGVVIGGLIGFFNDKLLTGLGIGLLAGLGIGLLLGSILGLIYGGAAYFQHYCLRFLLWRRGAIPWHFVRFLEEASGHLLLQRVGGGYRFIHPLFLEYFASLSTATLSYTIRQP